MFPRAARSDRLTAFVLAAALLLAQAIGFAHGVVHPVARPGAVAVVAHTHTTHVPGAQHDVGSLSCQVLDQLSHTGGFAVPVVDWVHASPSLDVAVEPATPVHARCARGWHARGPPSFLA